MAGFLARRLIRGAVTLVAISVTVFVLTRVLIDPVAMLLPEDAGEELVTITRERLGLDQPIADQFRQFVGDALTGDFGESFYQRRSSLEIVFQALPATFLLAGITIVLVVVVGVVLGIVASLRPGTRTDKAVTIVATAGVSVPEFWLALLLIFALAVAFPILPSSGTGSWRNLVLPVIVLSVRPIGRIAAVTRSAMLEEIGRPYTATAYSKGLRRRQVITAHVLKNAGILVVTITGIELADLLAGAIIVESIFAWPGIGWVAGNAIGGRDFPLIQTVVLWVALITIVINILVDLSYAWLDPRVRHGAAAR